MCRAKRAEEAYQGTRVLLISIHNNYARLILSGKKSVELRRRFDRKAAGSRMLIYATSPAAAVIGHVQIECVQCLSPQVIWQLHGAASAISKEDFDSYFSGVEKGCAVLLSNPSVYASPIPLQTLRSKHGLTAPQSYIFLREAHRELIEHEQN